jgi:hypothetical protein
VFDFFYQIAAEKDISTEMYQVLKNNELRQILDEVLETKNESMRLPKCAKGTRDMNPL